MTMRPAPTIVSVPVLVLLGGCFQDIIDDGAKLVSITEGEWDTYASSTTTGETPTTSTGSGEQADTSTSGDTGEPPDFSTTDPLENTPPTIAVFEVVPDHLGEAGPAELHLAVSDDAVAVRLTLDDEMLATVTPADFPRTWHAVSAADNGTRVFKVVVEDAEGLTAAASDTLDVLLPTSGVEKCIFEDTDAVSSMISAVVYTAEAIVAVGARDTGAGLRLTAWKLDPNDCEPLPGWPKSPDNWSADANVKAAMSVGVAVDVDADDNIVVAGNLLVNGKPQSHVVRLNPGGSRLWEKTGQLGDEATSVATATSQYKDRVFVGGSRRTSDVPVRTDAAVWIYQAIGEEVFISAPTLFAAPFTRDEPKDEGNKWSESVHALVIPPGTANVLAVGEREFLDDLNTEYTRAFTAIVHPLGAVLGTPWTSWAPAFKHDAVRSVTRCGDHIMAGGWTRDEMVDAKPQPLMFWLADDGVSLKHRHEPQLSSTEINGIACDRAGKIISAATRSAPDDEAQVFAVPGQNGPRAMYDNGAPGDDSALAIACDARGFCGWGGYRTDNGKRFAVVRVHHP